MPSSFRRGQAVRTSAQIGVPPGGVASKIRRRFSHRLGGPDVEEQSRRRYKRCHTQIGLLSGIRQGVERNRPFSCRVAWH